MKYKDFEDYLSEQCDCHTNNDPAGFDKWLEELDVQEYMDYADEYASECEEQVRKEMQDLMDLKLKENKQ